MRQGRIAPLLGPAAVAYAAAYVAASGEPLGAFGIALGIASLALTVAPLASGWRADPEPRRRVRLLGLLAGLLLVGAMRPATMPMGLAVLTGSAGALFGGLLIDLALDVPDRPAALVRLRWIRAVAYTVAILVTLLQVASFAFGWLELGPLRPPDLAAHPARAFGALCVPLALLLRLPRRRMGSAPEALASNAWAIIGLLPAAGGAVVLAVLRLCGLPIAADSLSGFVACALLGVVGGHVLMIDARRRLSAGGAARSLVAALLTLTAVVAAAVLVAGAFAVEAAPTALAVTLTLLVAGGVYQLLRLGMRRTMAPFAGRLLDALGRARAQLAGAGTMEDIAQAVLFPLREAGRDARAQPLLFTVEPALRAHLDGAGQAHVSVAGMPPALISALAAAPSDIVLREPLEARRVRRPDLRPLIDVLSELDALCVAPLSNEGELEGALVVPRGRRRSGLTLEELASLRSLCVLLSTLTAFVCAHARAQRRASQAARHHSEAEERIERIKLELERRRSEIALLRRAGSDLQRQNLVSYSPAMQELVARALRVAPLETPVLLCGEGQQAIGSLAQLLHLESGRGDEPFVVGDCVIVRGEAGASALFGRRADPGSHAGWLQLAEGGSLLLLDVPALALDAQRRLAQAVSGHQACPVDGGSHYPVHARIIATARVDLEPLVGTGVFDAELARWLSPLRLELPPLGERPEDLPSLLLLAVDRACRARGRPVAGIEPEAHKLLIRYPWPDGELELQSVLERAVDSLQGTRLRVEDLPARLRASSRPEQSAQDHPLTGSYDTVERRLLEHALARAHGNKSEAARLLGLKRTTFLDKYRRYKTGQEAQSAVEGNGESPQRREAEA
ncbi:MAG: sigma 54-interacting transcriptional regulator [Proteobacteria bacterium]|nr:sigma 54-interacting transcriptional regulator [Pseudomonadota bacterium]